MSYEEFEQFIEGYSKIKYFVNLDRNVLCEDQMAWIDWWVYDKANNKDTLASKTINNKEFFVENLKDLYIVCEF